MKIISIILSVMLLMVFLSNKRIDTNNNELQFKKWLVDTIPYVKDNFEIHLKSASNLNDNLNCSKELEHYAS